MSATFTPQMGATQSTPRNIRRTVLPNGLLVLTESIPNVRSVSMGVWIGSGSRDEPLALNGISHFVEHMVFKGTTSRSARQFAREVDSIGGNLDAFTGESSHGATKSIYGHDPDGNEFEIMWMLPQASWGNYANAAPVESLDLAGEVRRWTGVRTAAELVPVAAS